MKLQKKSKKPVAWFLTSACALFASVAWAGNLIPYPANSAMGIACHTLVLAGNRQKTEEKTALTALTSRELKRFVEVYFGEKGLLSRRSIYAAIVLANEAEVFRAASADTIVDVLAEVFDAESFHKDLRDSRTYRRLNAATLADGAALSKMVRESKEFRRGLKKTLKLFLPYLRQIAGGVARGRFRPPAFSLEEGCIQSLRPASWDARDACAGISLLATSTIFDYMLFVSAPSAGLSELSAEWSRYKTGILVSMGISFPSWFAFFTTLYPSVLEGIAARRGIRELLENLPHLEVNPALIPAETPQIEESRPELSLPAPQTSQVVNLDEAYSPVQIPVSPSENLSLEEVSAQLEDLSTMYHRLNVRLAAVRERVFVADSNNTLGKIDNLLALHKPTRSTVLATLNEEIRPAVESEKQALEPQLDGLQEDLRRISSAASALLVPIGSLYSELVSQPAEEDGAEVTLEILEDISGAKNRAEALEDSLASARPALKELAYMLKKRRETLDKIQKILGTRQDAESRLGPHEVKILKRFRRMFVPAKDPAFGWRRYLPW